MISTSASVNPGKRRGARGFRTVPSGLAVAAAAVAGLVFAAPAHAAPTHAVAHVDNSADLSLITAPADGLSQIYDLINSATSSIDMTMYELNDTTAEQDLVAAAAKGVDVRVILDYNLEQAGNQAAYTYLSDNGVNVEWANTTYAATHEKSIVVDDTTAAIMTLNLTSRYYSTGRDFAVIDTDQTDVAAVEAVFNADYADESITPSDGDDLVWSPTDSETQLIDLIDSAKYSLSVENEEMDLPAVTTALEDAAENGVSVEVVMTNTDNDYESEYDALTSAGVSVSTYAADASLYIHAKVIIADSGYSDEKAFVGSENFSNASLNKNGELGLITSDSSIVSSLQTTLDSDYNGGTIWTS